MTTTVRNIGIVLYDAHIENIGIGEFENSLAKQFAAIAPSLLERYNIKLWFLVKKNCIGRYGNDVNYITLNKFRLMMLNHRLTSHFGRVGMPKFDIIHWTHQHSKLSRPISPFTLCTVHDVNFFHNQITGRSKIRRKVRRISKRIGRASHLAFISGFSQEDVIKHLTIKQPHRLIYNGVTDGSQTKDVTPTFDISHPFFLCICTLNRKKGQHLLIEMMRHIPEQYHLLIAGSGHADYVSTLQEQITSSGLDSRIKLLGKVSAEEKSTLYRHCEALLFPSISEGFGLPVVEAQCYGKPVFCSRLTSLPEVGGDAAYYYDELIPEQMAETTMRGMEDFKAHRDERIASIRKNAARFNWKKTVSEYVDYYLDILGISKTADD